MKMYPTLSQQFQFPAPLQHPLHPLCSQTGQTGDLLIDITSKYPLLESPLETDTERLLDMSVANGLLPSLCYHSSG